MNIVLISKAISLVGDVMIRPNTLGLMPKVSSWSTVVQNILCGCSR